VVGQRGVVHEPVPFEKARARRMSGPSGCRWARTLRASKETTGSLRSSPRRVEARPVLHPNAPVLSSDNTLRVCLSSFVVHAVRFEEKRPAHPSVVDVMGSTTSTGHDGYVRAFDGSRNRKRGPTTRRTTGDKEHANNTRGALVVNLKRRLGQTPKAQNK